MTHTLSAFRHSSGKALSSFRVCLLAASMCAALLLPAGAQAATFRGRIFATGLTGTDFDITGSGESGFLLGPHFGTGSLGPTTTEATALVQGVFSVDHLLGLLTDSRSSGNAVTNATAFGAYRDIIHVSSGSPLPPSIRVTFDAHASLGVTLFPGGAGSAGMSVGFIGYDEETAFSTSTASVVLDGSSQTLLVQGFESSSGSGLEFGGRFSGIVAFDPVRGGYPIQLVAAAATSAFASHSVADLSHTISLVGIGYADGSPIDGASFSFESGLQSAPEPATLTLAGLCLAMMAGLRRRRM